MRIAVIAADGRSGRAFVETALAAGHRVRAGIRGRSTFQSHPNLTVVTCDATNASQVSELLQATDVVVSLLGHVKGSAPDVQTNAIKTVLGAMKKRNLRRIVSLTGTGVRIDGDLPNLADKIANAMILRIDPDRIHDGIEHVSVLRSSDVDFTVVRVLKLTDGNHGTFGMNQNGPAKLFTSRREVARAILDCLEDNRFIRKFPVIVKG